MNKYMKALSEYRKLESGKLTQEQFYDYVIENFGENVDNIINVIDSKIIAKLNEMYGTEDVNRSYYELGYISLLLKYEYYSVLRREFNTHIDNNASKFLIFMNMLIEKSLEANDAIGHFHIDSVYNESSLYIGVDLKGVIIKGS